MKRLSFTLLIFTSIQVLALPETPSIMRDVHMTENQQYTRPTIPAFTSSADSRIAISHKGEFRNGPRMVAFRLQVPEKINVPFIESPNGTEILASANSLVTAAATIPFGSVAPGGSSHLGICDPTVDVDDTRRKNPYACNVNGPNVNGENDCYDLFVVSARGPNANSERLLQSTEVTVRVQNPKTANARIVSVTNGVRVVGTTPIAAPSFFEPNFPKDGRLLVFRQGNHTFSWPDSTGTMQTSRADTVYAVNDNPGNQTACDITQFTNTYPLSHAPYDTSINTRYGFAMQPFRDMLGQVIPEITNIPSYPWIDKDADNVSMATYGLNLYSNNSAYNAFCPNGITCGTNTDSQNPTQLNGRVIMGLWTQGKMVMLDNLINNIDFNQAAPDSAHRDVRLYDGPNYASRHVRVGNGRDNATSLNNFPAGSMFNTTFLDSNEHRFNFLQSMTPVTPNDVVWLVSSGRGTSEVPFDDYTNVNSFINANMARAHDHITFTGFNRAIGNGMQNAATATRWNLPAMGTILGNARVEPVANGGIHGKGLWLDGNGDGLQFPIGAQPRGINSTSWYYSLFIDLRSTAGDKSLITYPDGSEIQLRDTGTIVFVNAANQDVHTVFIPASLRPVAGSWSHLGFQLSNSNRTVNTYVNGNRINNFTHSERLFRLTQGNLIVGQSRNDNDLHGWVDNFKVFAENANFEVACNHANGTLVGVGDNAPAPWSDIANSVPNGIHTSITNILSANSEPTHNRYVCYNNYSADNAAHLQNIPSTLTSVRDSINFPEGPIIHNQPRPNSIANQFCLSCHTPTSLSGLHTDALVLRPNVFARDDERRQPMQPDPIVHGNIPVGWLDNGRPFAARKGPFQIDRWLLVP